MKIATISNVRVSNAARESNSLGKTLKVAFQGGSVMGLSVGGFALLGLLIIYVVGPLVWVVVASIQGENELPVNGVPDQRTLYSLFRDANRG